MLAADIHARHLLRRCDGSVCTKTDVLTRNATIVQYRIIISTGISLDRSLLESSSALDLQYPDAVYYSDSTTTQDYAKAELSSVDSPINYSIV